MTKTKRHRNCSFQKIERNLFIEDESDDFVLVKLIKCAIGYLIIAAIPILLKAIFDLTHKFLPDLVDKEWNWGLILFCFFIYCQIAYGRRNRRSR